MRPVAKLLGRDPPPVEPVELQRNDDRVCLGANVCQPPSGLSVRLGLDHRAEPAYRNLHLVELDGSGRVPHPVLVIQVGVVHSYVVFARPPQQTTELPLGLSRGSRQLPFDRGGGFLPGQ